MTLNQILDWADMTRPNAYTPAQKTAWVSDLEASIWTQIFLQPPALWRPYSLETDGRTRLLLPDGWRRVYTAYLDAMIDLANGEYSQYQNSMSLYNGHISELGAWYADAFEPARVRAKWTDMGAAAYTVLTDEACRLGLLRGDAALLAIECGTDEAFDGSGVLTVCAEDGTALARVNITKNKTDTARSLGFLPPRGRDESLILRYSGDKLSQGKLRLRALIQPAARRESRFT